MTTITKLTKEQLIEEVKRKIAVAERYPDLDMARIEVEIFKIALASLTAEPVLYAAEETLAYANMGEIHLTCLSEPMGDAVIPLYTAPPVPIVPDGWVMVPKEPTRQMMAQGHFAMKGTDRGKFRRIYQAMITAASALNKGSINAE
ncbi:hypothetical protein E1L19_05925 [Salmonella enterica subsp. enterica]|nr:hypothetical protein [Salmonella enterica subsp. enterica]